jgi:uncharacterized protein (TIGR03435 family)
MTPVANHLWQSTLFAMAGWVLTLALRNNRAAVRYWVWLAASAKFLLPFSLFVALGSHLGWRTAPITAPRHISVAILQIGRPFTATGALPIAGTASPNYLSLLLTIWLCGVAAGLIYWARTLIHLRAIRRAATPVALPVAIPVLSSPAQMEPGVFGIRNPVLILPAGIAGCLTPAQLDAVLAHELCHVRRKDNLTAAVHMLVETVFWFHPLLWWIRTQLVAERERACDEAVLAHTADPRIYAEAIVGVCKLYLESPAACVSGITGGDLQRRVSRIMTASLGRNLSLPRKLILTSTACGAIALPVAAGLLWGQPAREFEAVSVKPYQPQGPTWEACNNHSNPTMLMLVGCTLRTLIEQAYDLKSYQMSPKGAAWIDTDRFVIQARSTAPANRQEMMKMLQPVLAARFHLTVHWVDRQSPALLLEAANHGPKLPAATKTDHCGVINLRPTTFQADCLTLDDFAEALQQSFFPGNPVLNRTGVSAGNRYEFKMEFNTGDDPAAGPSVSSALEEQLGLKLKAGKAPVHMLAIDRAERPQAN